MKKLAIYLLFFISLILVNCQDQSLDIKTKQSEKMETQIKNSSLTDKAGYIVHINALSPYELYLDDILIDFYFGNNISNTVDLNPFILNNGKHNLRIKFFPKGDATDHLLSPKDIIFDETAKWHIYFSKINLDSSTPLGYTNEIDYDSSELNIIAPPEKVHFWEQKWEIDVKDLPYKLRGWSESQDLRDMDQDVLEKEVLNKFIEYKNLLDEGKIDEYLKLGSKKDQELNIATYVLSQDAKIISQKNKEKMVKLCIGNMQNFDNYVMKIYAEGRLVSLEVPTGKFRNWNALMSKTPTGRVTSWGIKLHKPIGSSDFEIIRK